MPRSPYGMLFAGKSCDTAASPIWPKKNSSPCNRLTGFSDLLSTSPPVPAMARRDAYHGLRCSLTAGNHRLAILSTVLFFVVGLAILARVNEARGKAAALAEE